MKIIIQRVLRAEVTDVEAQYVTGKIDRGLFVLFGVGKNDTTKDADVLAEKLVKLRIMPDEKGKMNLSIKDVSGEVLVVSQFTLYADTSGGNRPSFIDAAEPQLANELYGYFINKLRSLGIKVATGKFGAYMHIEAVCDGPVTIILDSETSIN